MDFPSGPPALASGKNIDPKPNFYFLSRLPLNISKSKAENISLLEGRESSQETSPQTKKKTKEKQEQTKEKNMNKNNK